MFSGMFYVNIFFWCLVIVLYEHLCLLVLCECLCIHSCRFMRKSFTCTHSASCSFKWTPLHCVISFVWTSICMYTCRMMDVLRVYLSIVEFMWMYWHLHVSVIAYLVTGLYECLSKLPHQCYMFKLHSYSFLWLFFDVFAQFYPCVGVVCGYSFYENVFASYLHVD